jgi:hypothetical protein
MNYPVINLIHIFIFAPLLLLLANNPSIMTNIPRIILAVIALGVLLYHGSKALKTNNWVYWLHSLVIAPLLIWIAWKGVDSNSKQALQLLAISAIAYHSWRIYQKNM